MTTLQVRRATVRSRLSIVEIDDNGNRTRYIAENVIEDYAQKLAAAPELLERTQDFNNLIDSILSAASRGSVILEHDMLEILREHRILNNAAIAKAEAQK